jgi:voltage-gated potassium channel
VGDRLLLDAGRDDDAGVWRRHVTSDVGRVFSIVVLLSGVVFLLVMLPFLFIRLFYAPWLEARVRLRAPREAPATMKDHVIIVEYDAIAVGLTERLAAEGIPYAVIEPDSARARQLFSERVFVLAGENDHRVTYEPAAAQTARMVLASCEDTTNTKMTLTVREVAPAVPVVAIVEQQASVDILALSGATTVLALKHQLGAYLANRVDAGRREAHAVGEFRTLQTAELPARDTPFAGRSVRETKLRQQTGVSVAWWDSGSAGNCVRRTPTARFTRRACSW